MSELHKQIASVLGWTVAETKSYSLPALRDLVRPVNEKLAHEITEAMNNITSPEDLEVVRQVQKELDRSLVLVLERAKSLAIFTARANIVVAFLEPGETFDFKVVATQDEWSCAVGLSRPGYRLEARYDTHNVFPSFPLLLNAFRTGLGDKLMNIEIPEDLFRPR